MKLEELERKHAELSRALEAARLQEGTQCMRDLLQELDFYGFSLNDLMEFAALEKQAGRYPAPREEETGPAAAIRRDTMLVPKGMRTSDAEEDDEAAVTPQKERAAMTDEGEDGHRYAGNAAAPMTTETLPPPLRAAARRCPQLQLRGLLSTKVGRRR